MRGEEVYTSGSGRGLEASRYLLERYRGEAWVMYLVPSCSQHNSCFLCSSSGGFGVEATRCRFSSSRNCVLIVAL